MDPDVDITAQLHAWGAGDTSAREAVFPLVYEELRRIAHRQMSRERSDHTLDTTALVHEAYLKLVDQTRARWTDRSHFFAVAATAMRRIMVDYARRYGTEKRGGALLRVSLTDSRIIADNRADLVIAVDEALAELAQIDPRLSQMVECRFFAGLSEEETAQVLGVTARTVRRDWTKAKGWLHSMLG